MESWRAVAHGLAGGGAAGVLLWAVILLVSRGAGGPGDGMLLLPAVPFLAGLLPTLMADTAMSEG